MDMECFETKHSEVPIETSSKIAIVVIVGLPGSGKTTLCHTLRYILGSKYHVVHICYDEVVPFHEIWSAEENHGLWKRERAKVLLAAETFICNIMHENKSDIKEKSTSTKNQYKESELFVCMHQNYSSERSRLEDERNKDIFNKVKAKEHTERTGGSEYAIDAVNIRGEKNAKGINFLVEKELVEENFACYSILNSVSESLPLVKTLYKKINSSQRGESEEEVILMCVDDNCYYRSMRKEWWNLAAKYELSFCTILLKCGIETCIERVKEREQSNLQTRIINVPAEVIERMAERMEFPDEKVNQWEKHSLILDTDSLKIPSLIGLGISPSVQENVVDVSYLLASSNIKHLLHSCLIEPVKPQSIGTNSDTVVATPSLVHRVDLALRQIVGKSDKSCKAQVNKKRKVILNDLRNGKLYIPNDLIDKDSEDGMRGLGNYLATLI